MQKGWIIGLVLTGCLRTAEAPLKPQSLDFTENPIDAPSVFYVGRQVPSIEGDDIVFTEFYNGNNQNTVPYIDGTGVAILANFRPGTMTCI